MAHFFTASPFGGKAFSGEFPRRLPILQATFDRDRLVLFEVEHETLRGITNRAASSPCKSTLAFWPAREQLHNWQLLWR